MKAYYHSINTFGTVDGPGIRYLLFLAGCNLGCSFCHNPDTWVRTGKTISVDEIVEEIKKYRVFYDKSGGGITVSGGEPLLQAEFVSELFAKCKELGIHTALDTGGFFAQAELDKVPENQTVLSRKMRLSLAQNDLKPRVHAHVAYLFQSEHLTKM